MLKDPMLNPCPAWAEKLAATHPDDLSLLEREALEMHVSLCSACTIVRAQYQKLGTLLRDLPADDPPPVLPPKLLHLREEDIKSREPRKSPLASAELSPHERTRPNTRQRRLSRAVRIIAAVLVVSVLLGVCIWRLPPLPLFHQQVSSGGISGGPGPEIAPHPVFYQSSIYVGTGELQAFRSDNGSLIRSYKVGSSPVRSPAIVDGIIYMSTSDATYALRVSNGSILWHYPIGNASSLPPTVADGVVYIGSYNHYLYALRASDGVLLWRYEVGDSREISTPVVAHGVVYVSSADEHNAYIDALSTSNAALLWHHRVGEKYIAPMIADGILYIGSNVSVSALRASDGFLLWHYSIGSFVGLFIVADGVIYVIADNGYIYALHTSNGALLWRYKTGDAALSVSSPIVINGVMYAALFSSGYGYVYALRASDGHILWQYKLTYVIPALTVGNGSVYVVSRDHVMYALRARNGAVLWHIQIN